MVLFDQMPDVTVILPCLNEELALPHCLEEIGRAILSLEKSLGLKTETLVVDNNSRDKSASIIKRYATQNPSIHYIYAEDQGYGSAYLEGFKHAHGKYIFMADADNTYNLGDLAKFIQPLHEGQADMVIGNRFAGKSDLLTSMPWLHLHIGNPLLSFLVRIFFNVKVHDVHCGMRSITRETFSSLDLHTGGMEFASEMLIKTAKRHKKVIEIPIEYRPRIGDSKLRSFSDGWRHVRFILLYSPLILFLAPGALMFLLGTISFLGLYFGNPQIFGLQFYVHPLFVSSLLIMTGYQLILFAGFARTYAVTHLGDKDSFLEPLYRKITIEKAGFAGITLSLVGVAIYMFIFVKWVRSGFGSLDEIKNSIAALTFITIGIQTFFGAFMFSILGIKEK